MFDRWLITINDWTVAVKPTLKDALNYLAEHYKSDISADTDSLYRAFAEAEEIEQIGYFESYSWRVEKSVGWLALLSKLWRSSK